MALQSPRACGQELVLDVKAGGPEVVAQQPAGLDHGPLDDDLAVTLRQACVEVADGLTRKQARLSTQV